MLLNCDVFDNIKLSTPVPTSVILVLKVSSMFGMLSYSMCIHLHVLKHYNDRFVDLTLICKYVFILRQAY